MANVEAKMKKDGAGSAPKEESKDKKTESSPLLIVTQD